MFYINARKIRNNGRRGPLIMLNVYGDSAETIVANALANGYEVTGIVPFFSYHSE